MGQFAQQSRVSLWDFGRIDYRINKMMIEYGLLNNILSSDIIESGVINPNGNSVTIKTNIPIDVMAIKFLVNNIMATILTSNKDRVLEILVSLGYGDNINNIFYTMLNRLDMLYTTLLLTEDECTIILI